MARIESLGEFFRFSDLPGRPVARKEKSKRFRSVLRESLSPAEASDSAGATGEGSDSDLEELLDEVHEAGDALRKRQSEPAIIGYRQAVRSFVQFVMRRAYQTVRHHSRPNALKGTQRQYVLVQTVDQKLERLVVDVLQSQLEQMELLRRIEEINGLLVDLMG